MDFELSPDEEALRDAARDLLDGLASPSHVRAHLASAQPYDAKLWAAMVDQGWMGVALPEQQGGLGLGWVEAAVLLEEIGRHTAPVPFLPCLLAMTALTDTAWAEPLVRGAAIACTAWSRNPTAITASPTASGARLTGRTDPVIGADVADVAVVWTPEALYAVDLTTTPPGRPTAQPAMDATRSLAWLELDQTPAVAVGGPEAAARLLDLGAVGYAAEMLGGASRILEMTADYAKNRVQFGQPIGSFQAVKHRCADMVVDVEGMRSTVWYGAWCVGPTASVDDVAIAASSAKVWCSDASRRIMASGLQVHGGIGFTWEHDLHLFLKRAHLDQLSFGDATYHRERLATLLRARVDAGKSVI
jgi:alkylation response protein AidB-like acyl-CoA dehydrogenase